MRNEGIFSHILDNPAAPAVAELPSVAYVHIDSDKDFLDIKLVHLVRTECLSSSPSDGQIRV